MSLPTTDPNVNAAGGGAWEGLSAWARFLWGVGEGAPAAEGSTILGRRHKSDLSGGFVLVETDDPATAYAAAAQWTDILEFETTSVIEDAEAGAILANYFKPE